MWQFGYHSVMKTIINTIPEDICSLQDYQRYAEQHLAADVWAYVAGAAADGLTLQPNRQALDQRLLNSVRQRTTVATVGAGRC